MSAKAKTGHERIIETVKIALMAAIISVLGPLSIPLPFTPVPVSFTIMAVYLTAYLLGAKTGTVSVIIYILLGLAGVPVFSGFTGGAAKLVGPTGGYIIGFIFIAVIGGIFVQRKVFLFTFGHGARNGCLLPFRFTLARLSGRHEPKAGSSWRSYSLHCA